MRKGGIAMASAKYLSMQTQGSLEIKLEPLNGSSENILLENSGSSKHLGLKTKSRNN